MPPSSKTLDPTWFLDSDSEAVRDFAAKTVGGLKDPVAIAEGLFYAVRDGIRYDPYRVSRDPAVYRASVIAGAVSNWCVPKSVLLTACARAHGIPARLGFADVLNHLTSDKLSESMGTDLFAWHGYAELWLNEKWVKLSTAFNIELCERFGVAALEFDPVNGALMHPYDTHGRRHMEYVRERGSFDDLPLDAIFETFDEVYPTMTGSENSNDAAFH
ncbi:transglutaminase-like domain-containing protein [Congregibacter litoralis]|uniref:Transglutaminase-like enzyme, putative cysteine protease n=1 Tax=Congregibacter litoralis KT71 TaxID=314285 RepID=A4AC40_9GAMM|nr:transglutaminase family protein [Congregibacter litoralis]EAQ96490.1 Transglutaminase-like enzyme, putative cysteine protease [Congregibacter litoralis KT71]